MARDGDILAPVIAKLRARWPAIRASLIALAIAIGMLDGCPMPAPQYAAAWAQPVVVRGEAARRWLLRPVRWLGEGLDVQQRWSLFTGASRKRFRLCVEGYTPDGRWHLLYRAGDPAHDAYAGALEYRRVRGMFSPRGQTPRGQYASFARWIARRVLADHPDYQAARTRLERIEIGEGGYTATDAFVLDQVVTRGAR